MGKNFDSACASTAKHLRRSVRLKEYDYSQAGAYFITVCAKERKCLFGDIQNSNVTLSPIGETVQRCWNKIPDHFNSVKLDAFVVMPNHLHGIIFIINDRRGVQLNAPTRNGRNFYGSISPKQKTLSVIIRTFKAAVTTQCRANNHHHFRWQRNYYEHIVRNEDALNRIREYIINNPLQWQFDRENSRHVQDEIYDNTWGHLEEAIYGKTKNCSREIVE